MMMTTRESKMVRLFFIVAGLKRELDNAYKQIEMYKRTIDNLKGKDEGDKAELKVSKLENDIVNMDG